MRKLKKDIILTSEIKIYQMLTEKKNNVWKIIKNIQKKNVESFNCVEEL